MAASDALLATLTLGLACCLVGVQGLGFGTCPIPPSQANFDLSQYVGTWYEQSNFFRPDQVFLKCIKSLYALNGGSSMTVTNTGQIILLQLQVSRSGRADQSCSDPAKMMVTLGGANPYAAPDAVIPNYQVVETDYTSYAVVFSCDEILGGLFNNQQLTIMTRSRSGLTEAELDPILSRLNSYGISTRRLRSTNQSNCI